MIVVVSLVALVLLGAGQTTVSERRPADVDDVRLEVDVGVAPEEALLSVPGVALTREGGPLAPARPVVRGLSGSRLDVSVLGLPFSDPAAGAVDAGLLPWVLGNVDVDVGAGSGLGGSIAVQKPLPGVQASVVAGELSTLLVQGRAVQPTPAGVVGVAGSLSSSRGDFFFRADDALGTGAPLLRRFNNEQKRAGVAAFATTRIDDVTLRGASVIALHEGGVPGFATAPFETLRGRSLLGAGGLGLQWRGPLTVDVAGAVQGSERATTAGSFSDDDASVLLGSRVSVRALVRSGFSLLGAHWSVDGVVDGVRSELPALAQRLELGVGGAVRGRAPLGSLLVRVDLEGGLRALDDVGVLPTGSLRLGLGGAGERLWGFIGLTRAARAPTLDERFAPQGFVLGNPELKAESASEVEGGVVVALPARVAVRAVAHASVVDDAIVLVNRSAFAVVPENTGPARRAGVDLGARLCPSDQVSFDVSASMLASDVDATHAPLPGAPPILLRLRSRVGDDDLHFDLGTQSRGASASTLFGTLVSPGATLVDVGVRIPLAEKLGLGFSVHNALDVLNARDTNLLPLPGRLFFISLEVKV